MNIASRRNPYVQLVLYPALVQGEQAKYSIVKGIQTLDRMGLDVLIVGRGGGSIEDLWAFNEEIVARAIFACNTPVISAVGHETDVTIADYVADMRAPTPSAAAELAVFDYQQFEDRYRCIVRRCKGVWNVRQRSEDTIWSSTVFVCSFIIQNISFWSAAAFGGSGIPDAGTDFAERADEPSQTGTSVRTACLHCHHWIRSAGDLDISAAGMAQK